MPASTIFRLARAELSLGRTAAIGYTAAATAGAALAAAPDSGLRSLGVSLIMGTFIAACFHLPMGAVFEDIARGTRAFTLALPVTPAEYAAGKLLANGLLFLAPSAAAAVAVLATPADQRVFQAPLVAFAALGWLVFFVQNLGLAMVTESAGITIAVLIAELFMVGNGAMILAPRVPGLLGVWAQLETGGRAWHLLMGLLGLELAGVIALTLALMNRKQRLV